MWVRRMPPPAATLVVFGVALILAAAGLLFNTYWGDSAIYLPYARRFASGDFFSYNTGVFSSGSTSPLWVGVLSIPFLLGLGPGGAKAVALLATLAGFAAVFTAARTLSRSALGAAIASLYVVETLTPSGLLMYESSLLVAVLALGLIAGDRLMVAWSGAPRRFRDLLPLIMTWAVLPLLRPDAVVLVGLQWLALAVCVPTRALATYRTLGAAAAVAAVPSACYYGYSLATLGTLSVSARARAFSLREMAQTAGSVTYSGPALGYLVSILYAIVFAVIGLSLFRRDPRTRWLSIYGLGALLVYPVLLVFVAPVTSDVPRYFLPLAPVIVVAVARLLHEWTRASAAQRVATAGVVALLFVLKPAAGVLNQALEQHRRRYEFDEIVEREAIDEVNRLTLPGDTLLAYEAQDRYFLREDVDLLSLDGLTDGHVARYQAASDMAGFLKDRRPAYWLANAAVDTRPFLRHSLLHEVVARFAGDGGLREVTVDGVTFRLVHRRERPMPRGFAGWTYLFALAYGN